MFNFGNVLRRLTVQNSGHLFQSQCVLFDSEGAVDGTDSVSSTQSGVGGKLTDRSEFANQLCDFYDRIPNSVGNMKGRVLDFRIITPEVVIFLLSCLLRKKQYIAHFITHFLINHD